MQISLIILAFLAGVSSFLSPCAFPLLPTYIAFIAKEAGKERDIYYGIRIGVSASVGLVMVYGVITIIQLGLFSVLSSLYRGVVMFLALGLVVLGFLNLVKHWSDPVGKALNYLVSPFINRIKVGESMFLYGVVYAFSSLACSGPILFMIATLAVSEGVGGLLSTVLPYLFTLFLMMVFFTSISTYVGYYLARYINKYMVWVDLLFSLLLIFSGIYIFLFELGIPIIIL